jgi:hypothetical protein
MSFCTLLGFRPFQLSSLESMAGTTARTRDLCRDSDLQTRGERLRPSKSCKTTLFVDRIVDRKIQILTFTKTATDKLGVGVLSPTASGNLVADRTDSLLVMPPS